MNTRYGADVHNDTLENPHYFLHILQHLFMVNQKRVAIAILVLQQAQLPFFHNGKGGSNFLLSGK